MFRYGSDEPAGRDCPFLGEGNIPQKIRNVSSSCAGSFRKSDLETVWAIWMVTPGLCLNFLGYCNSQLDTQYVVSLELTKQGKLKEN